MSGPVLQNMVGGRVPINIGGIAEVELQELLGSGGFGWVWRVSDTSTSNNYVLKVIQDIIPGSIMAERVRLEAEVLIPSEHVVRVMGLREWSPDTFLILFEHFQGHSLDILLKEKRLSSSQKKSIFKQTLIGVRDAHLNNVIHRDLKPHNILVGDDNKVKLIDFGISKFKGKNLTRSGQVIGTIPYMAPELLVEGVKVADARADIFSLGHILYELAMGQHFWERQRWKEFEDFIAYLNRSPSPTEAIELDDFRCDFYPTAKFVIQRMVKLDLDERYESVDEILADLGENVYLPPAIPKDLHLRSPLLIIESGDNRGARTVLGLQDGELRRLGRADIAGDDTSITREHHLEFIRSGNHYFVRDLGSKRGTMVRGIALDPNGSPVEINHTDRVRVGDVFLRFVFLLDT